jgi:hypothetical protein
MLLPILYQGSGGTIGDTFVSSIQMYNQHIQGRRIYAALPKSLPPTIKKLYEYHTFIDGIIYMDDINEPYLLDKAQELDMAPCIYLKSTQFMRDIKFFKLSDWFKNPVEPNFDSHNCIGIQIVSSSAIQRPPITQWDILARMIKESGKQPYFHGSVADEAKAIERYPNAKELCGDEKYWRFGKDDVLQTIANLKDCYCAVGIGSWSVHLAVMQGVPALDFWPTDSWQFFSPVIRHLVGNPIHYIQDSITAIPPPLFFSHCVPNLRSLANSLYF